MQYNDQFTAFHVRPEIENVGSGNYGILYMMPIPATGACYFDRSDWVTGVAEYKVDDPLSAYISLTPNPARNLSVLSFVTQQEGRVSITLYDAVGRLVENIIDRPMSTGNHSVNLDAQNLAAGIYFVRVETPDGVGSKTMTIVK